MERVFPWLSGGVAALHELSANLSPFEYSVAAPGLDSGEIRILKPSWKTFSLVWAEARLDERARLKLVAHIRPSGRPRIHTTPHLNVIA